MTSASPTKRSLKILLNKTKNSNLKWHRTHIGSHLTFKTKTRK